MTGGTDSGNRSRDGYRWVMLALLLALYTGFGLISASIFPLVTPILADLGLSNARMGFILGSWQLTYILAALIAGPLLDRWGVRGALTAGAVIIGLSAILRGLAGGFGSMLAAVALFGLGGPMISIGGPKAISEWFDGPGRGTAVGVYMMGPRIGALLALALTNSMVMPLTGHSWRAACVFYGLLALGAALLWRLLARTPEAGPSSRSTGPFEVFRALLRVRELRLLLVMALLAFGISHGFGSWLPRMLEVRGLSPAHAGLAASVSMAAGLPAILLLPRLVPAARRARCLGGCALLGAASLAWIEASGDWTVIIPLALLGAASTLFMPFMILILMDNPEIGARYMGSAGGIFFCVAEIGGFTGPWIMGLLADLSGAFTAGSVFLAGLCLAIFGLSVPLGRGART
ncbi:MAG: MFS transporter [Proteobacteria bacterium]|nr:MFS transporter [Pseudomonadota bacterium]